tara:strand:+ start:4506 stop:4709 length:204 start_codon:yes stop_codon:yes gene_type:complete
MKGNIVTDFNNDVLDFVEKKYGEKTVKKINLKKNSVVVNRILEDSQSKSYSAEKTGNKIIAMLRINP